MPIRANRPAEQMVVDHITGGKLSEEQFRISQQCPHDACIGQPLRMAGVCLDIAELERMDECRAEAQRDFDQFFNLIPDLACIVSTNGYFIKVNQAWETTLGFTLEGVLKTPMIHFIHPDDLDRTLAEVARQGAHYRTRRFVNRYRCKDGSYRTFEWATTLTRNDSSRFGVARDVTDQLIAENATRELACSWPIRPSTTVSPACPIVRF